MRLEGTNVLITGGAGLIGSHIADLLLGESVERIVILDDFSRGTRRNLENALESPVVQIMQGDVRDEGTVCKAMKDIDLVFHQAAIRITQCAEDPKLAHNVLAGGTFNVVQAAVDSGVQKMVAASSASVYGLAETFPTEEDHHPYDNDTLYGAAKLYLEGMLRSFYAMHKLDYVALRYFNVYGPRMDIHGVYTEVLIRWMERILAGESPVIFGDGKQTMDFVYVEDVARANILAAKSNATDQVFNIASGTETSLQELCESLLRVFGSDLDVRYEGERNVNPVSRRLADVGRASRMLGFDARYSLKEGMSKLVEWWRESIDDPVQEAGPG